MALTLKVTNNATGSLNAGITAVATTLVLKAAEGLLFPSTAASGYFYVTIQADSGAWEIVKVTTKSTDTFTIERNVDSSTGSAQAFAGDDIVTLRPCQSVIDDIITEINLKNPTSTLTAPSGTEMVFYQAAAPTGWTINATPNDAVLAVKGGSDAYNAAGGTLAGTWTQPNHVHAQAQHTHTIASDNAAHTHTFSGTTNNDTSSLKDQGSGSNDCTPRHSHVYTGTTDSANAAHDHGAATGNSAAVNVGNGATAITWRPYAALTIIASKD
jgi:hypothetical protein